MAVKVTIVHDSPTRSEVADNYEKGRGAFLSNGHLIVGDHPSQQQASTLAIYAPEKWESVEVTGKA